MLRRFLANIFRLLAWPLLAGIRSFRRSRKPWLYLRLSGSLLDFAPPKRWWQRAIAGWASPQTTAGLTRAFDRIAERGEVAGLVVELWPLTAGWATCHALREALATLQASGTQVVVYLPQGAGERELLIAGAAGRVLTAPHTQLRARGLSASRTYFGSLLRRVGVGVQVSAAGRFKTAAETLVRDRMSEAEHTQLSRLLHSLAEQLTTQRLPLPNYPHTSAEQALQAGTVAALAYPDELARALSVEGDAFPPQKLARYLSRLPSPVWQPLKPAPYVAVVMLHGMIGHGVGGRGARGIRLDPMVNLLRAVAKDPRVQAVVLHIDSPGGSAANSDLLHREVARVAARKLVVAWFANVAASGGYYIACAAQRIVADPMTITGSIGVIGVRPVLSQLLGWAGVRVETVKTAPHADMDSPARAPNAEEDALVREEIDDLYDRFVEVVAEGRGLPPARVRELAGGRVYSGKDAADVQLVDVLGGEDAVRRVLTELLTERAGEPVSLGKLRPVGASGRASHPLPPAAAADSALEASLRSWAEALGPAGELALGGEPGLYLAAELPRVH